MELKKDIHYLFCDLKVKIKVCIAPGGCHFFTFVKLRCSFQQRSRSATPPATWRRAQSAGQPPAGADM